MGFFSVCKNYMFLIIYICVCCDKVFPSSWKDEILIWDEVDLFHVLWIFVAVVMHKDKEENSHHDSHYRARELAALAAYDHHHLDGEMFLQVSNSHSC